MIKIFILAILMFGSIPAVFAEEYICMTASRYGVHCTNINEITIDDKLTFKIFKEIRWINDYYIIDTDTWQIDEVKEKEFLRIVGFD